jgi:hypothetical protein
MSKNIYIPKETKELIDQLPALIKRYYLNPIQIINIAFSLPTKPEFPVDYVESYRFGANQVFDELVLPAL